MERAAWTVKKGTREERSGRLLFPERIAIQRDAKTGTFITVKCEGKSRGSSQMKGQKTIIKKA